MSGLGERGKRLRRLAEQLEPPPAVKPYFVQAPDEVETVAIGWHMKASREEKPDYLGHSFIAAELRLRRLLEEQKVPAPKKRRQRAKAA